MKRISSYIFIGIGVLSIILGIISYSKDPGGFEKSIAYGGDSYTGIQDGVIQTANNVKYLTEVTAFGFGSVLTVGGVFMLVFGIKTLAAARNQKTDCDKEIDTTADTVEDE